MNGITHKNVIGLMLAAAVVAPALGAPVEEWCDTTTGKLLAQRFRGDAAVNGIVALRCVVEPEYDERLARACAAVRHDLAGSLSRQKFDVVEPRNGFAVMSTWEHVSCGRGSGSGYLGRTVVEIRMSRTQGPRQRRDDLVLVSALAKGRKAPLHQSELSWMELEAIGRYVPEAARPPFFVSRMNTREELVASHLADLLACPLKQLPEKYVLGEVAVRGAVASPAQLAWAEHVGDRLAAHLNRVLRSGYVFPGSSVLELSFQVEGGSAVRVIPRLLLADANEPRVLLDGDHLCADRQCVVEFSDAFTAPRALARPVPSAEARVLVEAVGRRLGLPADAVRDCLLAVERGGPDAAALHRLLRDHDPRTRDATSLPGLWRAWYEFAHPLYEPYFPDSPVNTFVEEVEGALFERLDRAVFDGFTD